MIMIEGILIEINQSVFSEEEYNNVKREFNLYNKSGTYQIGNIT